MPTLKELLVERETLEKQIALVRQQQRQTAISEIRELMSKYGLSVNDLNASANAKRSVAGKKVEAKYRHHRTGQTWSGRGLHPKWLAAELAAGRRLEDFLIQSAE